MHRTCTQCQQPIVLVPSAADRAKKYGGTPQYFLNLFTQHSDCAVAARRAQTLKVISRMGSNGTPL